MTRGVRNIILDFGHGGIDNKGKYTTAPNKMAVLPDGTVVHEGVINRQIGGLVYHMFKVFSPLLNTICVVDYKGYRDLSLLERVKVVNQYDPFNSILISIHCNAFNGKATGFEAYTLKGQDMSDILAQFIINEVKDFYTQASLRVRQDKSDGDGDKENEFYILKHTKCPSVLLECLFFDNPNDYKFLNNVYFQRALAYTVYKGINKFIENENEYKE